MPSADDLYAQYTNVQLHYATRNAKIDEIAQFFKGDQWEELDLESVTDLEELSEQEEIRLVLNYAKKAVYWHVGLLTGKPPRVDVPVSPTIPDIGAARREGYLRAIIGSPGFRRAYRRLEMNANKYGYAVLQALWSPTDGQPESRDIPRAEGSSASPKKQVYSEVPLLFRSINPRYFYPVYRTYDTPDDYLYVFRLDPDRLVEDLEEKYKVLLSPTDVAPGSMGTCDLIEFWSNDKYLLMAVTTVMERDEKGEESVSFVPYILADEKNSYGRPPFYVLPNLVEDPDDDPTWGGTIGEVALVEDVNRHLNLITSLSATEIATRIHPPTAYKSSAHSQPLAAVRMGAGEVIPIRDDEDLIPLDWSGVPRAVAEHRNSVMAALRDISGLPKTALGEGAPTSGIGMRLAYSVLEMIIPLKLPERVEFLQEVCRFILKTTEKHLGPDQEINLFAQKGSSAVLTRLTKSDVGGAYSCTIAYGNLMPRDKVETEQHIVYLQKTGTISHRTALELLDDIPDPEAELERLRTENSDVTLNPELAGQIRQLQQPSAGGPPQQQGPPAAGPVQQGAGLKMNAAPPVPQLPSMPTQQNAPFLERGVPPNLGQVFPGGPGVNPGPPLESQP